jgi:hypothetical protein
MTHFSYDDSSSGSALDRFVSSLDIDYEKWHDGIRYDVDALRELSPAERADAEWRLDATRDWRDVEALAVLASLGSESARTALREASTTDNTEIRLAVMRYAPELVGEEARTSSLLRAIAEATSFGGLTETIEQIANHHPPAIVEALWGHLLTSEGSVAVHYAAMLAYLYGKGDSTFDWAYRPLFVKFNTPDAAKRREALAELRALIGVAAVP